MTATTQPGITLEEQIATMTEHVDGLKKIESLLGVGIGQSHKADSILASLIRLREIEGDVKRYRWLRNSEKDTDRSIEVGDWVDCRYPSEQPYILTGKELDLAIDALLLRGKP